MDINELLKRSWPQWEIIDILGTGAYGIVYKAEMKDLSGIYYAAIKHISIPKDDYELKAVKHELEDKESVSKYFKSVTEEIVNEFILMKELKGHPNIVNYEDHAVIPHKDDDGWDILIRMELLTPLTQHNNIHPMDSRDVVKMGIDLCHALELCEKRKIIHRDIKPANIFFSESGDYKLGDFGVARTVERTMTFMSKKGTFTYMAPEVYNGLAYNNTVDIYSLGITMYRFCNHNRAPFLPPAGEDIRLTDREQALLKRIHGYPLPLPDNCDSRLGEIICKACAYRSDDRFQSARDMMEALEQLNYFGESESEEELFVRKYSRFSEDATIKLNDDTHLKNEYSTNKITDTTTKKQEINKRDDESSHRNNFNGYKPKKTGFKLVFLVAALACILAVLITVYILDRKPDPETGSVVGKEETNTKEKPSTTEEKEKDDSNLVLQSPKIEADNSMQSGQNVTWDCVWFGSYPQTEIIRKGDYKSLDNNILSYKDYEIDKELFDELKAATGWDDRGDITLNGKKYRRLKRSDATHVLEDDSNFYHWEADDKKDEYHYFRYEPIKWRVLSTDGATARLLADKALDDQKYNDELEDITWENSSIRSFLNKGFLTSAFSEEQQEYIMELSLENHNNLEFGVNGGNNTTDRVFLLSQENVFTDKAYDFGFVSDSEVRDNARFCKSSTYAKAMGTYTDSKSYCWWWLRSPGHTPNNAAQVDSNGTVGQHCRVDNQRGGVRPCIILDLSASVLYKYAGTVSSDGTTEEK